MTIRQCSEGWELVEEVSGIRYGLWRWPHPPSTETDAFMYALWKLCQSYGYDRHLHWMPDGNLVGSISKRVSCRRCGRLLSASLSSKAEHGPDCARHVVIGETI